MQIIAGHIALCYTRQTKNYPYWLTAPVVDELDTAAAVDEPAPVEDATGSKDVEGIPAEEEDSERRWAIRCSTSWSIQLTQAWCSGESTPEDEVASDDDDSGGKAMIDSVIKKTFKN